MMDRHYGDFDGVLPSGAITAHRTDGSYDFNSPVSRPGYLRSSRIEKSRVLTEPQAAALRAIIADPQNFGNVPMRCFTPGLGFTLGEGEEEMAILVCLQCLWVRFYRGEIQMYEVLSERGQKRMKALYRALF